MTLQKFSTFVCGLLWAVGALAGANAADLRVIARQSLDGDTKWDYLSIDAGNHRLFITHGDRVDVFDTQANKVVGVVPNTPGVHGVALAPELNRGYTSNGLNSTVTVFELSSLKVLGTLPTEKKPDAIVYDALTKRVFAANGDSGTLTVIDALSSQVIATIQVGGKLEFQAVDGKGLLYVNVEDKNLLAVVDTVRLRVINRHDISPACESPTGLSIDAPSHRLFIGCRNEKMAVVDGLAGVILASIPVGKGCDATAYDAMLNQAYASSGDGTLTVLNAQTYQVEQTLKTQPTARTTVLDPIQHQLYLVAADVETPGTDGMRPKLTAGTFKLLTVGR